MTPQRKLYDIIPGQAGVVLSLQFARKKQSLNIPLSAFVSDKLDLELLEKAVLLAVERNDMFGLRLTKIGGVLGILSKTKQYFDKHELASLERLDFTGKTDEAMRKEFERLAGIPLDHFGAPLGRVYICTAPNGNSGLFIVFSHIMADTWGCYSFFNDAFSVYLALANGTELPKAPESFETCIQEELKLAVSPKAKQDMEYWRKEYENVPEPMYTSIQGTALLDRQNARRAKPRRSVNMLTLKNDCSIATMHIPKAVLADCLSFCKQHGYNMQTLYLAGVRTYLSRTNRRERDVSLYTVMNHRAKLIDKRSGGCRVHYYPFRTIVEENTSFLELCELINNKITAIYRHSDANPIEVHKLSQKLCGSDMMHVYITLSVTVQTIPIRVEGLPGLKVDWYNRGYTGDTCYSIIEANDASADARVYIEYRNCIADSSMPNRFVGFMTEVIKRGLANPDITVGELLDIEI